MELQGVRVLVAEDNLLEAEIVVQALKHVGCEIIGPVARLEVTVHGRPFWVDVSPAQARTYQRKKPLALAFDADDCVVIAPSRAR